MHLLYIDPGTGSLLLQLIIGGVVASTLFFKNLWIKFFSIFKKKDNSKSK